VSLAPTALLIERHRQVQDRFDEIGIDALVVTHSPNIFYLTNHAGSAGILVLAADGAHLLVDARYTESVRNTQASASASPETHVRDVSASYDEALVACLLEIGVNRVGFEAAHLTVSRFDWLRQTLAAKAAVTELRPTSEVVEQGRIRKDEHELALMRTAASRLTEVADAAFAAVRPGVAEREVAAVIEGAMRSAGYDRIAFDTIVASGPHAALPHHRAGNRRLAIGDVVVLDFGGVLDGYCCDLTRTVSVGLPTNETRRVYAAVRDAQQAAIDAVRPEISASDVDAAARTLLEARGLGEAFGHGTGHGLGVEVHELPRITRLKQDPTAASTLLQPGMIFTIEPGAYLPGWGGVRIEDDVLVTAGGCEVLTTVTRELLAL